MRRHLVTWLALTALFASVIVYLTRSGGDGTSSLRGAPGDARGHVALNMNAGDHAKVASLGYNMFDVGPSKEEVDALPKDAKALLWVGELAGCDFKMSLSEFTNAVKALAGNARVFGWYLADEPNPEECPDIAGKLKERADIIHANAKGQKAFASLTDYPFKPLRPEASHLDLIGVDPYPCLAGVKTCKLDDIDRMVRMAEEGGFTRSKMVPVFQTFGQSCNSGEKKWRLPSAAELRAMLQRWDKVLPDAAFDISYSWGRQTEWACPALADADGSNGNPDLQAVMKEYNLRTARTPQRQEKSGEPQNEPQNEPLNEPQNGPGNEPQGASWGEPVLSDDFDGDKIDEKNWLVDDSPEAKVNPRTKAAARVVDDRLELTGAIYDGKDLSGGIASRLNQTHGRWEVRMKADAGVGYSAAALLWPEKFGDPEYAQIDIVDLSDPTRRTAGMFAHYGPKNDVAQKTAKVDFTTWHTLALDWRPGELTFWIDGKRVWTYRGKTPEKSKMGLALYMDQVCDRGPGFCRDKTTPAQVKMYVDWVRIYKAPTGGGSSDPSRPPYKARPAAEPVGEPAQ